MHHGYVTTGDDPKVIARWNEPIAPVAQNSLLLITTLNACLLQKLAVLLLRHPLTTLLYYRAHGLTSLALSGQRRPAGDRMTKYAMYTARNWEQPTPSTSRPNQGRSDRCRSDRQRVLRSLNE